MATIIPLPSKSHRAARPILRALNLEVDRYLAAPRARIKQYIADEIDRLLAHAQGVEERGVEA